MKNSFFKPIILKKRIYQSIDSKEIFQALLDRERERADRNGSFFSLLTLTIDKRHNDDDVVELISALKNRIRSIDELGWIDTKNIGVILPDTSSKGALGLAREISRQLELGHDSFDFNIHTYPEQNLSNNANQKGTDTKTTLPGKDSLARLTGKPMPVWKRTLDITGACLALILLSPLLLCIAIFIKSVSSGSVLFKQERLGHNGKPFMCWKFRTMHCDTDPCKHQEHVCRLIQNGEKWNKLDDRPDAGIIPLGNILRKSGMDELPQLINVLRGEMSLIGPRPCIAYEASEFLAWQHKRFDTHPGLTGLWQVSGKNQTTFNEMIRLDIAYGQKRSLLRDTIIFFKTFPVVIKQSLRKL